MKLLIDIPATYYNHIVYEDSGIDWLRRIIAQGEVVNNSLSEAAKEYIKSDKEALKDFHVQNFDAPWEDPNLMSLADAHNVANFQKED